MLSSYFQLITLNTNIIIFTFTCFYFFQCDYSKIWIYMCELHYLSDYKSDLKDKVTEYENGLRKQIIFSKPPYFTTKEIEA